MQNFSVASVIEKNKLSSTVAWLVAMEIDVVNPDTNLFVETIRVVHNPEDFTIDGNVFTAFAFEVNVNQAENELPTLSVTMQDQTRVIQSRMQQYKGGLGFNVRLMVVNTQEAAIGPEIVEYFKVISANVNNYAVTWQLGAEDPLRMPFPRRKQTRDRCQWKYKSAECGYTGALPTCDRTLTGANGCRVHENALHYGGFPGINTRM